MPRRSLKVQEYKTLRSEWERLGAKLQAKEEERGTAVETVRSLVDEFAITDEEIRVQRGPGRRRNGVEAVHATPFVAKVLSGRKAAKKATAKIKRPKRIKYKWVTGGKTYTWTGAGTQPRWVAGFLAGGGKLRDIQLYKSARELKEEAAAAKKTERAAAAKKTTSAKKTNGGPRKKRGRRVQVRAFRPTAAPAAPAAEAPKA